MVSICILSGDGGWQVRDVDVEQKGRQADPWGTPFLRRRNLLLLLFPMVRVKLLLPTISMIMWVDNVSIRQQSQQFAGKVGVSYSFVGCCEVYKHSSDLPFSRKAILDVLCQHGDLVYGRPPVSKARLLLWEQWVDDWIDTRVNESLEDIKGHQQRYGTVALWVSEWLFWFRDRNY